VRAGRGGNGIRTIESIVEDIASVTTRIDVAVGTHEHRHHLSGFLTAAEAFDRITFDEVWLAWTENPVARRGGSSINSSVTPCGRSTRQAVVSPLLRRSHRTSPE
jgi:hypothetical protein